MATKQKTKNSVRASDLGETLTTGSTGFAVRKRTGVGLIIHFFLLACMVVLGTTLLIWYESPEGCLLAVVIGMCFAMIAQNLEKMKKVKQSLEFMNALFSSALGKGYQFCAIVKNNGDLVFYNRPFQALFPAYMAQSDRKLDTLLSLYNVPSEQRTQIQGIISANVEGVVATTIREESSTNTLTMSLCLEPIERPTGFFLLRAK